MSACRIVKRVWLNKKSWSDEAFQGTVVNRTDWLFYQWRDRWTYIYCFVLRVLSSFELNLCRLVSFAGFLSIISARYWNMVATIFCWLNLYTEYIVSSRCWSMVATIFCWLNLYTEYIVSSRCWNMVATIFCWLNLYTEYNIC